MKQRTYFHYLIERLFPEDTPTAYNAKAFDCSNEAEARAKGRWRDERPMPTRAQLDAEWEKLKPELEQKEKDGAWLKGRISWYARTDRDKQEALIESMEGRPEKLQKYLADRAAMKKEYPKP